MLEPQKVVDATFVQLVHSLKVLASIRENDRISTKKGIFVDSADNQLQSLYRWMASENRKHNLSTLESVFDRGFEMCTQLIRARTTEDKTDHLKKTQQIRRLEQEIYSASRGIENLMVTYATDSHTVARLVLLNECTQDRLQQIRCMSGDG
jgi:hypothetical protein